jgi:hypothetical protein
MKKSTRFNPSFWLPPIGAAILLAATGCATPDQHSFNGDFGESLPTQPVYRITDEDANHFKIIVHQGVPSTGAERVLDVKTAANTVAKAESQRLGWEKWQLNYIQERNKGWMHIVIAEVTREKYVAPTFPQSNANP